MHQEEALLGSNAMVSWLDRGQWASTKDIAIAIATELGALVEDVSFVKHFLEAYLIRFFHQHHCVLASGRHELLFSETKLQLWSWRLEDCSKRVDLIHHVWLCLDGLPLQAWDDYTVAQPIGQGCSIDYIETVSKLNTDGEVLGVWAGPIAPVRRLSWELEAVRHLPMK
ncbi:hypothetical protein ZWY2020_001916 [Hordeum vulgare]|nr:hypothetical protein ZWY2020_001916 [Hordeum vulgare]